MNSKDVMMKNCTDRSAAPMACPEAKAAAEAYLQSVGTPDESRQLAALYAELQEDITGIADLLAFAKSPYAKQEFGEEGAQKFLAHVKDLKAKGAKYCDCPACTAALAILKSQQ